MLDRCFYMIAPLKNYNKIKRKKISVISVISLILCWKNSALCFLLYNYFCAWTFLFFTRRKYSLML